MNRFVITNVRELSDEVLSDQVLSNQALSVMMVLDEEHPVPINLTHVPASVMISQLKKCYSTVTKNSRLIIF